jgi:hypothetical protein
MLASLAEARAPSKPEKHNAASNPRRVLGLIINK